MMMNNNYYLEMHDKTYIYFKKITKQKNKIEIENIYFYISSRNKSFFVVFYHKYTYIYI